MTLAHGRPTALAAASSDPIAGSVELFLRFPQLIDALPWAVLGSYPTPIEPLALAETAVPVYVKREDLSADGYGGNKVRTIEGHLGRAVALGRQRIWATGAWGSNHAVATATHAPRLGLRTGAILIPQPPSLPAHANLRALAALDCEVTDASGCALRPIAALALLRDPREVIMTPGGAIPLGSLGHVSAALELAGQVAAGLLPAQAHLVVTAGSTATSAGLLVGLHLAARLGIGWRVAPQLVAVPVAPNPFASAPAIAWLARRTLALLQSLLGRDLGVDPASLRAGLRVDNRYNGRGYGYPTESGEAAKLAWAAAGGPALDTVYTSRSGAGLLALLPQAQGPVVHWMTKANQRLPRPTQGQLQALPPRLQRWLERPPLDGPEAEPGLLPKP